MAAMNGAQLLKAHDDSSGLMSRSPAYFRVRPQKKIAQPH
jgi:hypothetical protein